MADSIASAIIATLKCFNDFAEWAMSLVPPQSEILNLEAWEDELGRLRIWAANIGAHKIDQSSLDFRLRDASHIRDQIVKLLKSLDDSVHMAQEMLRDDFDNDQGSSSETDDDSINNDSASIMMEIQDRVAGIIKSLFQMSMLVRKPAQHDFRLGASRAEVEAYEPYDTGHIRDKFPKADEILVLRLAAATMQRRMYLKYRERHAAKLKQDKANVMGAPQKVSSKKPATVLSDTVASEAEHWNIEFEERGSISGDSQTSYAATLMNGGNITIPPPPKESHGNQPFECPICYYIIKIQSAHSWNKHVFFDLQPYVCLDLHCEEPQKIYATRRLWLHHAKAAHSKQTTTEIGESRTRRCPLCTESFGNAGKYDSHCARHLQDLALFVLPPNLRDVDEETESKDSYAIRIDDTSSELKITLVTLKSPFPDPIIPHTCPESIGSSIANCSPTDKSRYSSSSRESNVDQAFQPAEFQTEKESLTKNEMAPDLPHSPGSSIVNHISNYNQGSLFESELLSVEKKEETYKIKCICGFDADDGNTVLCDQCDTWQHIECYYFNRIETDTFDLSSVEHLCADCSPRHYDKKAAIARQTKRFIGTEKLPVNEKKRG